jgi:hypothetical protein
MDRVIGLPPSAAGVFITVAVAGARVPGDAQHDWFGVRVRSDML